MDSNFRSTVLQRHADDDERDRDKYHRRDVMNPAGTPRQHSSTFSLRSPTLQHADYHPSPYASSSSPNNNNNHNHNHNHNSSHSRSPSRPSSRPPPPSSLHNRSPYMPSADLAVSSSAAASSSAHPLPPPVGLSHSHSTSPLHPPTGYYPPPTSASASSEPHHHHHSSRDTKPAIGGRVYDPTTDTTKERRLSDSWHNSSGSGSGSNAPQQVVTPKPREPYQYPPVSVDQHQPSTSNSSSSYYNNNNGNYSSPRQRTSSFSRPLSPLPHAHSHSHASHSPVSVSVSAGYASPPRRHPHMTSPSLRHAPSATSVNSNHDPNNANGTSSALPPMMKSDLAAPSPPKPAAASSSAPSRAADPMSFSTILSNSEPASATSPPPAPAFSSTKPAAQATTPKPVVARLVPASPSHPPPPPPPAAAASDSPDDSASAPAKTASAPVFKLREPDHDGDTEMDKDDTEPEPEPEPVPVPVKKSVTTIRKRDRESQREKEKEKDKGKDRGRDKDKEKNRDKDKEKEKEKGARKSTSKGRALDSKEAEAPKKSRRVSVKKEKESSTPRPPSKRQANGLPKQKTWSTEMERKIQNAEMQIQNDASNLDPLEFDEDLYKSQARKRRRIMAETDADQHTLRLDELVNTSGKRLAEHAELGKRRYDDVFYDEALREVRDQELYAEKERKKDMQRKRRREKSMAVTIEQKEAALARAEAAEDEAERQKHLRDAERANKKAQQTKLILQKGIKGPARNVELNLEGGTTSSFQASDVETPKAKSKRSGNRPKKSKEQKQAEKDSAEAAQAALDAGEELPPPKEEARVRIKIKGKSKTADADKPAKEKAESAKDKVKEKEKEKEKELEKEKVEEAPEPPEKFVSKGYNQIYDQIWRDMARKDVSKTFKLASDSFATRSSNLKKTAILASKEAKRWQLRTNKGTKDLQARAKRVMRDMMSFWKRNEREERDLRKAAEKQEIENARKEEADRESARQKRKLNFLISQTELYSHFIGKKIKTDEVERSTDNPDIAPDANEAAMQNNLSIKEPTGPMGGKVTHFENLDFDDEDETALQAAAMANAQNAIAEAQKKARAFNNHGLDMDDEGEMNFQNPTGLGDVEIEQPKLINAQLKEYQLKGLNWLVNLYEQGINGILADEMGLGKTVQSISVMAYLAEKHDIWGPFLVVAPASTLHNWQQEIAKFVPEFKILPYWGSAGDRKVLRKFWDRKHTTYKKDAPFHVCVTSYQLVVSDVAYFQKMRWQYMILDEAQAIKSSQSSRWKCLLGFHCRNRLLLTGTPIQNNMQELWALLHFIMPSLFDSHDEFSEWFSKDIESHAQSNTKLNEDQLKRLHMILKPFMLRRVKKHVQKELGDKIEMDVFCNLTYRQRAFYSNLRNQINIMDLVEKATMGDDQDSGTLMNLVMQFRKVCNHPDLFERAEVTSSYSFGYFAETASFVREGSTVAVGYSARSLIDFRLPSLVWAEGGRLDRPGKDNDKAGWRNRAIGHLMNIWAPENVQASSDENKAFSWLRFADATPGDVYKTAQKGLFDRAVDELRKRNRLALIREAYDELDDQKFTPQHCLFKIRERENILARAEAGQGVLDSLMNISRVKYRDSGLGRLEMAARPRASAPPIEASCNKPSSMVERENVLFNAHIRKTLYGPTLFEERSLIENKLPMELYPSNKLLPPPDQEKRRFTNITVPSMHRFVTDSGKLKKLDELLFKLKNEGHRVLLYFQMTRMIDMMEDYLTYRNYKYCRLDGSTKLEDRRDTVHDFQTRPEIFIFLLSTRAGGLGINLTSADTVIFYDSDWNPTIDSQAMDRAHRLGQTRQVTVYRLITRGTIEERIRKRALQKEEVQRVVIQGGGASVDFSGRRAPENRNRDIAMWLADDEQAEMIERRERELLESGEYEKQKKKGGKRKKAEAHASLDDMYHEGEGNFDDGTKIGASGTATPAEAEPNKGKKSRAKGGGKRAKTTTQRLALADGIIDI